MMLHKGDNNSVLALSNTHENWKFFNLGTVHNARFVLNNYSYLTYRIPSGNLNFFLLAEFVSNITWTKTRSRNDFNCTSSKINVRVSILKFKINLLLTSSFSCIPHMKMENRNFRSDVFYLFHISWAIFQKIFNQHFTTI